MMRTDPSENGGLFLSRRPGTAPVRFRGPVQRGGPLRQRIDGCLAAVALATIACVGMTFWVPIPLACLWIGSRVDYLTGSVSLGLLAAFTTLGALLLGALQTMHDVDRIWVLLRRAAGYDQRAGALNRIFALTTAVGAVIFVFWFVVIHGPGSTEYTGVQVVGKTFPR
jgi:cytochrome bd-type quinol oxidase subunit 2